MGAVDSNTQIRPSTWRTEHREASFKWDDQGDVTEKVTLKLFLKGSHVKWVVRVEWEEILGTRKGKSLEWEGAWHFQEQKDRCGRVYVASGMRCIGNLCRDWILFNVPSGK